MGRLSCRLRWWFLPLAFNSRQDSRLIPVQFRTLLRAVRIPSRVEPPARRLFQVAAKRSKHFEKSRLGGNVESLWRVSHLHLPR